MEELGQRATCAAAILMRACVDDNKLLEAGLDAYNLPANSAGRSERSMMTMHMNERVLVGWQTGSNVNGFFRISQLVVSHCSLRSVLLCDRVWLTGWCPPHSVTLRTSTLRHTYAVHAAVLISSSGSHRSQDLSPAVTTRFYKRCRVTSYFKPNCIHAPSVSPP